MFRIISYCLFVLVIGTPFSTDSAFSLPDIVIELTITVLNSWTKYLHHDAVVPNIKEEVSLIKFAVNPCAYGEQASFKCQVTSYFIYTASRRMASGTSSSSHTEIRPITWSLERMKLKLRKLLKLTKIALNLTVLVCTKWSVFFSRG